MPGQCEYFVEGMPNNPFYNSVSGINEFVHYKDDELRWYSYDVWYPCCMDTQLLFEYSTSSPIKSVSMDKNYIVFISGNNIFIKSKYSPLPSKITQAEKNYNNIHTSIRERPSASYAGMIYECEDKIFFREYKLPPPAIPLTIVDEGIPVSDIPPNNTKRILFSNNDLHIFYSKENKIYDAILKGNEIERIYIGDGKNPALSLYQDKLYAVWAYNDTTTVEEIRFSRYDTSWSASLMSYTNANTYFWGIGAPSLYIENDTGYIAFESTWGPTYHTPPGGPIITIIKLWHGKLLTGVKFPLQNPLDYEISYNDFIQTVPETLKVPKPLFYDSIVPSLISPSIVYDKGFSNIIWDGTNKYLKIYKIGNDTNIKIFYPELENVKDPYAEKENSIVRFIWVDYDSLNSKIYTAYTFKDYEISDKMEIYCGENIKEPFICKNYLVFVENEAGFDNLIFGELKTPFKGEILFSASSIKSPQILYDDINKKFHITFYAGDTVYNLYKIEKQILEVPPDIVINFGNETEEPVTVYREGFLSLGNEDYKNLDFGDSLFYEIPLYHANKVKIVFEAYLDKEIKEKIYINNHPLGVWHIKENEHEIYEKQIVPPVLDSILKIKIEKKQGDKVYLGKLSIYIEEKGGKGGVQGANLKPALKFSLKILPNIIKDKTILEIIIPEKQKIDLTIYDASGRKVLTLIKGYFKAGIHRINLNKEIKKGVYFAILKGEKNKIIRKFLILR